MWKWRYYLAQCMNRGVSLYSVSLRSFTDCEDKCFYFMRASVFLWLILTTETIFVIVSDSSKEKWINLLFTNHFLWVIIPHITLGRSDYSFRLRLSHSSNKWVHLEIKSVLYGTITLYFYVIEKKYNILQFIIQENLFI